MTSSIRNRFLVFVFAQSAMALQHGAFAQLKEKPADTILVVCAGMTFRNNDCTANQRFIPLEDKMTVEAAILTSLADQQEMGLNTQTYNVEVIRGEKSIQSKADLKHFLHDPTPQAGDLFLQRGDVIVFRPKPNIF